MILLIRHLAEWKWQLIQHILNNPEYEIDGILYTTTSGCVYDVACHHAD